MRSVHTSFKGLVLAGLLAGMGHAAFAQAPAAPPPPAEHMARHDPAKMQAHMAKRQAELKAKLKLNASQEGAWTTFIASMQPPAGMGQHPDRAAFDKLSTPERIDKMRAMRAQRDAEMDKRGDATKTFYAVLTPEQQKVFDANTMHHGFRGGPEGRPPHKG